MPLTSILRHLPVALLAATLTLACGPKNSGGDMSGSSGAASSGSTNGTQECSPGDTKVGEGRLQRLRLLGSGHVGL
jgi:hypothetical protein